MHKWRNKYKKTFHRLDVFPAFSLAFTTQYLTAVLCLVSTISCNMWPLDLLSTHHWSISPSVKSTWMSFTMLKKLISYHPITLEVTLLDKWNKYAEFLNITKAKYWQDSDLLHSHWRDQPSAIFNYQKFVITEITENIQRFTFRA